MKYSVAKREATASRSAYFFVSKETISVAKREATASRSSSAISSKTSIV